MKYGTRNGNFKATYIFFVNYCMLMKFLSNCSGTISSFRCDYACVLARASASKRVCVSASLHCKENGQERGKKKQDNYLLWKYSHMPSTEHSTVHTHTQLSTLAMNKWYLNVLNSTRIRNAFFWWAHRLILLKFFKTQMCVRACAFSSSFVFQDIKWAKINVCVRNAWSKAPKNDSYSTNNTKV